MNQLKAGVVLNYIVLGLNGLVGLLYTPYMLRMMGQSEYGLYALAASIIAYLTIMDFGFGNAIIRYTAKFRAEGKTEEQYAMFGMFALLYTLIGVVALIGGIILCVHIETLFGATMSAFELSRARTILAIMTFNLAISFPLGIFGSIITAYENFVFQKSLGILRILLNTAVMVCLLHLGYKAVAMVVVQTVFNLLTLLINFVYCKQKLQIRLHFGKFRWDFLREVAIYSFWIFLNAIMDRIYWSTGQFVLGILSGTVAVSVFALAIQLENIYMSFSTAIVGVFLPRVTAMVAHHSSDREISDLFIRTGRLQYAIMVFLFSGFIVFGRAFIALWAGEEYAESYPITLLFFGALLVPLIQNMGINILQARNKMKFRSLLYVTIAIVSLVGQIWLGRRYGALGCAIAIAAALILGQGFIMNFYYYRYQGLDIPRFWGEIAKMSLVPVGMTLGGVWYSNHFALHSLGDFLGGVVLFTLLYLPLFWWLGFNTEERDRLRKPLQNYLNRSTAR